RLYTGRDEFDGVAQQVRDALGQKTLVAQHRRQSAFDLDVHSGRMPIRVALHDFPDQFVEVDAGQGDVGAEDARVVQHVLNQRVQARGRSGDAAEIIAARRIEPGGV